jgi:arrestin-related trafficking adapter 3/6
VIPFHRYIVILSNILLLEKTDYYTQFRRLVRSDVIRHAPLLSIKHPNKNGGPILPLESDDPEAFRESPLHILLGPDDDPSEMASSLMGPGPWTFSHEVSLPASCGSLQISTKNKKSNITVTHTLKVIFRVERGDDSELDTKTGKRKLYDIVMQTPVHILSVRYFDILLLYQELNSLCFAVSLQSRMDISS